AEGPVATAAKTYRELEVFVVNWHKNNHEHDGEYFLRQLVQSRPFEFAVVNSFGSTPVLRELCGHSVPTLMLIHEFASAFPPNCFVENTRYANLVVFSSEETLQDALQKEPDLNRRSQLPILPQC